MLYLCADSLCLHEQGEQTLVYLFCDVIDIIDYERFPVHKSACLLTEVIVIHANFLLYIKRCLSLTQGTLTSVKIAAYTYEKKSRARKPQHSSCGPICCGSVCLRAYAFVSVRPCLDMITAAEAQTETRVKKQAEAKNRLWGRWEGEGNKKAKNTLTFTSSHLETTKLPAKKQSPPFCRPGDSACRAKAAFSRSLPRQEAEGQRPQLWSQNPTMWKPAPWCGREERQCVAVRGGKKDLCSWKPGK